MLSVYFISLNFKLIKKTWEHSEPDKISQNKTMNQSKNPIATLNLNRVPTFDIWSHGPFCSSHDLRPKAKQCANLQMRSELSENVASRLCVKYYDFAIIAYVYYVDLRNWETEVHVITIRRTPLPSFLINFSTFAFLLNFSFMK